MALVGKSEIPGRNAVAARGERKGLHPEGAHQLWARERR